MSINIKQADGLKRLSQTIEFYKSSSSISIPQLFTGSYNDLTDKPIVDGNATIESIETTQSSFYVQDGNGNTIALIDNQGVHSIDFYANGESVKQHMSSSTSQLNDLSGDLTLHKNNQDIHVTSEEREKWNDPLSGEGDTLYINDALGNTIAIFDANGLTTTNVTIKFDGKSLEISSKLTEIDNSLTSIQSKNNDQDGRLDSLETATEKLDFIDASESDTTLSIVDTHGNPIAQFDESGLTTIEVTIADAEGSPIQVGAKIKNIEGRISTAEGEIDTLQGQLQTLGNNFSSHTDDTTIHITASERSTWNTVTSKANQSDLNTTNQNLATEITNRQNADKVLQGNIDTEAQTRANEDAAINERTAEIEASENGVLSITDPSGNAIAQFDENGLLVTEIQTAGNVTVGGNITTAGNFDSKELSADKIISRGDIEAQGEVKGATITATGNVSAADVKTSSIDSLNTTISTINNNASALEGRVETAEGEIDTLQGQVSTLIASDSGKSVRKIANEELAAALIPSDAQESLNTLQEIADWIQDHPEDAAAMNSKIEANTTAINNHINNTEPRIELLEEKTANIEDSAESDAFIIYDKNNQPGFQVDANGTTVHTLKADNATIVNNVSVGSMSVGGVADIEGKLTNIDEAIQDLAEDLQSLDNDLRPNSHNHSNKALLDTYDQTNENIKDAVTKKHGHSNKTILDNTTASFTAEEKTKLGALPSKSELDGLFNNKQDNLTAGDYIDITNNTVSVKDLPYSALKDIPTDIVRDGSYVHTDNNFTNAYKEQLNNVPNTYATKEELNEYKNDAEPRIESLEEKTANIEDSAESDAFTIYDKNNQPGFQIDANGTFVSTLNVKDVVVHSTITTPKISVGEIVDLEEKINSVDQDIADINTQITTNKNNLSAEITNRTNADTQIRTDFAAADTQIRTDFAAADSKLKSDLQGEIDSDITSHNTNTSAHSDIRTLITNLTNEFTPVQGQAHSHTNKTLLDTYDQTNDDIKDAVTKKHEHGNKTVLDATTASFTTQHETKLGGLPTGEELTTSLNSKQDTLTPGDYIDITNNVIAVKDLPYSELKDIPTDIVHDANYIHTDNNFTNTYKGQLDDISTTYATKDELTTHQNNAESTYRKISDSYTKGEVDAKIPTDFYSKSEADAKFALAPEEGEYALYKEGTWQEEPAIAVIAAGGVGSNNNDTRISDLVLKNDIVNDLTSDLTNVPLSAAQGKVLKAAIDSIGDIAAGAGNGDMLKSVYDTNNNGRVDHAEYSDTANIADNASKLGGKEASEYALVSSLNDYRTISDSYSKTEVDGLLQNLPSDDTDTTYTFTNSGSSLTITPSEGEVTTLDLSTDLSNYYTKDQVYNKTEVSNELQGYATEGYVDGEVTTQLSEALTSYYTKSQVYSKDEVNNLIAGLEGGDIEIPTANSFVNIIAGGNTIVAESSTDTLTFANGANIRISSSPTTKTLTIRSCTEGPADNDGQYPLIVQNPMYQSNDEFYTATAATYTKDGVITANGFESGSYGISAAGIDPSAANGESVIEFDLHYDEPDDITSEGAWIINSALNVTNEIYEQDERVASRTWVSTQLNNYILLQDMHFVSYHHKVGSPINYSFGGPEAGQFTAMQLVYAQGSDDNFGFFYMPSDQVDADRHPAPYYQIVNMHTLSSALAQYVSTTSIGYHTDSNQNIEFSIGSNTASPSKSLIYRLNADGEGSFYYEPNEEISQTLNDDAEIATIGDVNAVKGQLEEYIKVFTIDYPGGLDLFYQNNYTLTGSLPNNMTAANLIEQGYNIICFVDGDLRIQFTMSQMSDEGMMMGYAPVPNLVRALSPQYISADIVVADSGYTIMLSKGQSIQLDLTLGNGYVTDVETLNVVRNLYNTYGLVSLRVNNAVTFVPVVCYDYGTNGLLGFITDEDIIKYTWTYNVGGSTQVTPTIKHITTEDSLTTTLSSYATKDYVTEALEGVIGGSSDFIDVEELPEAILNTATEVPSSGTIEKLYINTKLNNDEVKNILNQLEWLDSSLIGQSGFEFYPVLAYMNGSYPYVLGFEKFTDGDIACAIINFATMRTVQDFFGTTDASINWRGPFNNPYPINANALSELSEISIGTQNDKLKNLISTTPFETKNEDVELDKIYRVPAEYTVGGGATVPNTGTVGKIYFNTNMSCTQVESLLQQLNYDNDNDHYMLLSTADNSKKIVVINHKGMLGIFDMLTQNPYWLNQSAIDAPDSLYSALNAGWQSFTNPIVLNKEVTSTSGVFSVGTQNELIKELFYTEPLIKGEALDYKYHRVIDNKWEEVLGKNNIIDVEELPLLDYSVPTSGYIEKIYFNRNLSTEQMVEIFDKAIPAELKNSRTYVYMNPYSPDHYSSFYIWSDDNGWQIWAEIDQLSSLEKIWSQKDGWLVDIAEVDINQSNYFSLLAAQEPGALIVNDKLSDIFAIKPFGTKPEYELDKIYRVPVQSYIGTAVPKEDFNGTIYFNTNLTEKEVENIIANLPYGGTGDFPCYTVVAKVDESGVPQDDLTIAGAMGAYAIMDAWNARVYWANETAVALVGADFGVSTPGWQSYTSDTFGANTSEYGGTQVGTHNELLEGLFSTTPFEETTGYKYYRVANGKYIEVLSDSTDKVVINISSEEFTFTPEQMELIKEDKVILRFGGTGFPMTLNLIKTVNSDSGYIYQGWWGNFSIVCTIDPSTLKLTTNGLKLLHTGTLQFVNDIHPYDFQIWNQGEPVGYFSIPTTSTVDESNKAPTSKAVKDYVDSKTETNVDLSNQEVEGDTWKIVDNANKIVAQIDENGLTVSKINVASNTDNFVKTFRFGDYLQELDNNKKVIRRILTDVPNQNDWGALYEYFRQDVFQMPENIGPDSCVGYFVKAYGNAVLPTNLEHYLCAMIDINNLDSFKVEMLGSYGSAAECTMIISLFTRTAETYKLQICSQHDLIDDYTSSGWYKEGITSSKLLDLSNIITDAYSDTIVDLSNNTSLIEKIKNVETITIGQTQKVWCRIVSATHDPLVYFVGSYFGDTLTEHRCITRLTPDNKLEYKNI